MNPNQFIQTWRGPLIGLIASWGAPRDVAHELAQDTLVEAYLGRDRLRGDPADPGVSGPWLAGIAKNLWRATRRRKFRRREVSLATEGESDANVLVLPDMASRDAEAEDLRIADLRAAMARLPEKHRTVLYVYYLEDCTLEEAAGVLEIPATTLRGRLHSARNALRGLLGMNPVDGIGPAKQAEIEETEGA